MQTFQTAIADARSELGDTYDGSYAYTQQDMFRYAVDGVREAWRARPSLRYDPDTLIPYEESDVLPSLYDAYFPIPLPSSVQVAITYYVIYRCLIRDITDDGNKAAGAVWKDMFDKTVSG